MELSYCATDQNCLIYILLFVILQTKPLFPHGWDGNFLALQNATLAGGFLNYQKGASGQKRGPPSSSNSNGGVVFCRAYQTSSCTHAGDHQGDFRGETRLLKHICAKCWLENKTIAAHAEKSGVCPLDS